MKSSIFSLVSLFGAQVAAHGVVTKVVVAATKTYSGYNPQFQYTPTPPAYVGWTAPKLIDLGPVDGNNLGGQDIVCGRGASPTGATSATVVAGQQIALQWTTWPSSHHGPMLSYLAPCHGSCSSVSPTSLNFFKIDYVGMTNTGSNPPLFGDDQMIAQGGTWTVTIPSSIAAGNYVLRHETIALHNANNQGGAQPFVQCINLEVTGGGSDVPNGTPGTSLYKATDKGIFFNIYSSFTNVNQYPMPGPTMYSGASGAATAPVAAPASTQKTTSTSNAAAVQPTPTQTTATVTSAAAVQPTITSTTTTPATQAYNTAAAAYNAAASDRNGRIGRTSGKARRHVKDISVCDAGP